METANSLDKLTSALVKFQAIVPVVSKNRTANIPLKAGGSYSYKYADLADIWDAVRKPLADSGLAVTQTLQGGSDGHTAIETTIWHESGQSLASTLDVPTQGKTAQEVGSQLTYYKRYALGSALGISTEEDDDGQAGNAAPKAAPKASAHKPASEKQLGLIKTLAKRAGYDDDWLLEVTSRVKTSADASAIIDKLNSSEGDQQ